MYGYFLEPYNKIIDLLSQHISKVISLGRRNATVPAAYSIDQKAEEDSGRLEQHVVGTAETCVM